MIDRIMHRGTRVASQPASEGIAPAGLRGAATAHHVSEHPAMSAYQGLSGFEAKAVASAQVATLSTNNIARFLQGGIRPIKPSTDTSTPGSAEWGNLSTTPQTQALTPDQSAKVGGDWAANLKRDFGLTDAQAAGIVGNLWHESGGMNSGISQGGRIGPFGDHQDDNQHGIGIAQWGGTRADGLLKYAADHGIDPTSEAANYGFLKQELSGPYASSIEAVKKSTDLAGATAAFCNEFEKPTDPQMQSRNEYAQKVLTAMSGGTA